MLIKVVVKTAGKKYKLCQLAKDKLEVMVKEKAENGKANQAVIQLLALHFKIAPGKIRIIKGFRQPHKIIEVELMKN